MGAADPPGTTYHPGLRENLHGLFTINLGIYIPEVARVFDGEAGKFVQEYHCSIRYRLGELAGPDSDCWWRIPETPEALLGEIESRLRDYGLPFFNRFATRDSVLTEWAEQDENTGTGAPPRLVRALICHERGDVESCRALLEAQERGARSSQPHHANYVIELSQKLGTPIDATQGPP